MGYHICISNEDVYEVSLEKGVYGNVGEPGDTKNTFWGKLRDLYTVKPGDEILLYVKSPIAKIFGVYEVTSIPYLCYDDIFLQSDQKYPLRFNFKIKKWFPNPIPSTEFYGLIESGKINSLATLERDMNSAYRGIRQLFDVEFNEIVQLFYKYNPKTLSVVERQIPLDDSNGTMAKVEAIDFDHSKMELINTPTAISFNQIPHDGRKAMLENVLHTYIVYNVLHDKNGVREALELKNFHEIIVEAPVYKSMQYRSDILATYKHQEKVYFYSFFELKKDKKIGIEHFSQLIGYLKAFANSKSLPANSYEGVYISRNFDSELIDYLEKRKTVEKENIISLISYSVDKEGRVKFTKVM